MRTIVKQLSTLTGATLMMAVLAVNNTLAHEGESRNLTYRMDITSTSNSGTHMHVVENSSTWINGKRIKEEQRTYVGGTDYIQQHTLDMELHKHTVLAVRLLRAQHLERPSQATLRAELESNSQAIADSVNEIYPGTESQFLQLWERHILYYEQYLNASEQNDEAGRQQAKQNLANFAADTASLLGDANSQIDRGNLEQQLTTHEEQIVAIIDGLADGDYATAYRITHQSRAHMSMVASAMTGDGSDSDMRFYSE